MSETFVCGYCNNRVPFSDLGTTPVHRQDGKYKYRFVQCHTCQEISLFGARDGDLGFGDPLSDFTRLYPPSELLTEGDVPDRIRSTYEKAIRIKNANPDAFAGQMRKCLEVLCADQEAEGKSLSDKLNHLAAKGVLPATLRDMTSVLRLLGNIGVHAGDEEIQPEQAESIDEFFRWVVEFVYIAPAKVERIKELMLRPKAGNEPTSGVDD